MNCQADVRTAAIKGKDVKDATLQLHGVDGNTLMLTQSNQPPSICVNGQQTRGWVMNP